MESIEKVSQKSLDMIESIIKEAKKEVSENGFHFILWGVLVVISSLSQHLMLANGIGDISNIVWIIMPLIGVPIAFIYEWKKGKTQAVKTRSNFAYSYLWLGFGATLGLIIFIAVYHKMSPIPFILALVGMATFVSGAIFRYTPLIIGGIIFWAGGLICAFLGHGDQLLVNALATSIGYIIPGVMLWKKSKTNV